MMLDHNRRPRPGRLADPGDQLRKDQAVDVDDVGGVGGNGVDEFRRRGLG
jgi:hypothetical protein